MAATTAILVSVSGILFSVLAAHGFAMRRERNYRGFWGACCWALLPGCLSAIWLGSNPEIIMSTRNVINGVFGGVLGAAFAIWVGHLVSDYRAHAQSMASIPATPPLPTEQKESTPNIPRSASGNFNFGQKGGTNNQTYVNH